MLAETGALLDDTPNLAPAEVREAVTVRHAASLLRLGQLFEAQRLLSALLAASGSGYAALQLGTVARYRGEYHQAREHFEAAFADATLRRDLALAIGAQTGLGDVHLDSGERRAALTAHGRALGLTEFSSDERPTVAPLAGLAQVHSLSGNRAKGRALALRALERARRHDHRVGTARAELALALASDRNEGFERAALAARVAPHLPLWLRIRCAQPQPLPHFERGEALRAARRMGMPEADLLAAPGSPGRPSGG